VTCQEVVEFLLEYFDRTLPGEQIALFEGHLADCECCKHFLDQYRAIVRLTAGSAIPPPPKMPEAVQSAILEAIKAARGH
jgi:predicted anti-sigma-YlaC factor YlaD